MKNLIDPKLLAFFKSNPTPLKEIVEFLDNDKKISTASFCKLLGIKPKSIYDFRSNRKRKINHLDSPSKNENFVTPKAASKTHNRYSAEDKFNLVILYQSLENDGKGEFLREYGLYKTDIERWTEQIKEASILALGKRKTRSDKKSDVEIENDELKKELSEQEKTTAKLSTLLVLQKKTFDMLKKNG